MCDDPLLLDRVETTLIDLIALTLGAQRDVAEIARLRGLRAVRLQAILRAIKVGYADPAFSVRSVAQKLGLSPRYVNDLLQESGLSLSERVMELRLQQARAMLADARHDRLKIVEIAYACGFSEVSYFNRSFRRRFGDSPTRYRGTDGRH
jgi:AraC-like DNA-binding protein